MTKESLHQENTTIINICAPNTRAPKYVKNINRTEERDNSTIIARSFNTPLYNNGYYNSSPVISNLIYLSIFSPFLSLAKCVSILFALSNIIVVLLLSGIQ